MCRPLNHIQNIFLLSTAFKMAVNQALHTENNNSLHSQEASLIPPPSNCVVEPISSALVSAHSGYANPKTCKHSFLEREVYECEHCNKAFSTAYNLNRHKKGNCLENICRKCNLRFAKTEQLQEHNVKCTGYFTFS